MDTIHQTLDINLSQSGINTAFGNVNAATITYDVDKIWYS